MQNPIRAKVLEVICNYSGVDFRHNGFVLIWRRDIILQEVSEAGRNLEWSVLFIGRGPGADVTDWKDGWPTFRALARNC